MTLAIALSAQCPDGTHSPFKNQSWLSCNQSNSPVPQRGNAHWLIYDLAYDYTLDSLIIWNHNVWGETGNGAKTIAVDYSTDNITWISAGTFQLDEAPGSWKYNTPSKIELPSILARYVSFSILETHDPLASCAGLAEVKFVLGFNVNTEELLTSSDWSVNPNPVKSIANLDLPNNHSFDQIIIYDMAGRVVSQEQIVNQTQEINLSDQISGTYKVVLLDTKNNKTTSKSIVKVE